MTPPRARQSTPQGALIGLLVVAMAALGPTGAAPQDYHVVSFVGGLAYEPGGPGAAVAAELGRLGMDDTQPGSCYATVCTEDVHHPFYHDEGLNVSVLLGARYRFSSLLSVETLLSNGQRGHAEGFDGETSDHVVVSYASFLGEATVGIHLGPLRLAMGPAANRTNWEATRNSVKTQATRTWTFGTTAAASAGFRFGDVHLSLRAGLRRFPAAELEIPDRVIIGADYQSILIGLTATPVID